MSRTVLDVYSAVTALVGSDTTAPVVATSQHTPLIGSQITSSGTTYRISWSATDASGISDYQLYASTNGAAWARVTLASPTQTSQDFALATGKIYQFQVAARDNAGN